MTALHVTTQSNQSSCKYDVSIIIPFYKRQAEVEKLLTSLNNMDVEEVQLETIVVEDGRRVENSDQLKSLCNNINFSFHQGLSDGLCLECESAFIIFRMK